jgi:drug/metabolite transporter (DMT)-like permease
MRPPYDGAVRARSSQTRPRGLYLVLALGVCAVSVAAPLIKATGAPPLSIAAYRLSLASAPVLALALWRCRAEMAGLTGADRRSVVLSGFCLAGHFATWVASLQYGTVASSVALVTTSPFFVAGFALVFAREQTSRRMLFATGVCTLGGVVIAAVDARAGAREFQADLLALAGAAFAAAYLALGRRVRARVSLLAYVGMIYPIAALVLVLAAVALRQPLSGFSTHTYVFLGLLALVPQLFGHSTLNWSLGYLSAPFVAIAVLGEPVIATVLAAVFLHELPGWQRIAGGVLILLGVYLALREERARLEAEAASLAAESL